LQYNRSKESIQFSGTILQLEVGRLKTTSIPGDWMYRKEFTKGEKVFDEGRGQNAWEKRGGRNSERSALRMKRGFILCCNDNTLDFSWTTQRTGQTKGGTKNRGEKKASMNWRGKILGGRRGGGGHLFFQANPDSVL